MVDIGGVLPVQIAYPSRRHCVSSSRNAQGSVFQCRGSFGKEIQGQGYGCARLPNEPPTVLNATVVELKTKHQRRRHQLEESNEIVGQNMKCYGNRMPCCGKVRTCYGKAMRKSHVLLAKIFGCLLRCLWFPASQPRAHLELCCHFRQFSKLQ